MADWSVPLSTLGEATLARLSELLDSSSRSWRKLAEVAGAEKRFKFSEEELEVCSLKVLEARGSPSQHLLQLLSERDCTLKYLLCCLEKMGHTEAFQFVSSVVQEFIRITVQPESQVVTEGTRVSLSCWASGPPGLSYQWFCGKHEVPGATFPELVIDPATLQTLPAWYICRVNCGTSFSFSKWARVQVKRRSSPASASSPATGYCPTMVGLQILQQPQPCTLDEGKTLQLQCMAIGNPPPQYQWFRNGSVIEGARDPCFQVKLVTTAERGCYSCKVFNLFHEVWSKDVDVEIGPRLFTSGTGWQEGEAGTVPEQGGHSQLYATDKVALLIGNMTYLHHKHLKAPMVDVHELTNLLRQLNFKVVSLLDLSKAEMQMAVNEFLLLLDKGVYGLLYYAGHGYENFGNSFMVPIDAPGSYTSEHCLCVQSVLQSMQQRQTGLNIFLLDMCRKRNLNDDIIPQVGALQVTANIVFGYATCADAEAYELSQGELSNGIFVSFLKRWLLEDEKITVLLDKVAEDMGTLEITKGRQALELRSNLCERRALTDPIKPSEGPEEVSVRNLQWVKAHVLPESRYLQFDCGVRVQLGFAAEFSNILIIYTHIVVTPKEITRCEAKLTDIPEELDVDLKFTNKESPEEVGSTLPQASSTHFPDCCLYSRLCGLQKLKKELTFTICLQYQYQGIDDFIEESQSVNIGKPLIAKLNLCVSDGPGGFASAHSPLVGIDVCADVFTGSFQSTGETSQSPAASDACRSLPSGSHVGSWCGDDTQWVNTPEENLSPEFPASNSV
ncbi:PREDICTED: mucosa-associated lymphoid tissue lymphoma translocation protein 1-like [Crocodylus porosus]|uniref:mucosa-associated lymphoid tissue lymphoma translocation protein 1-like n=1 Tax=Crocodylus porosus TaxID=8502 RepID=UPI00093C2FF7|nr:PREDICTED: mucosa-associated lymphoid tissue lymphoma translocation protein 1-like [Crocodylus porosus]XP_019406167.1 PREDICTED: mucosa-associated lymphoid tissue lymphoma translocation protein 1-like [Crocodylus porosus]